MQQDNQDAAVTLKFHLVTTVPAAPAVMVEVPDHTDHLVTPDLEVTLVQQVPQDNQDQKVPQVPQDNQEQKVPQVPQDNQE